MCLLVFAWNCHTDYRLILAGNRDEFYARPTRPAQWWQHPPEVLAGRDLRSGGTWLGVSRKGRFGIVTNFRDYAGGGSEGPSRGSMIPDFATTDTSVESYCERVVAHADKYAPFSFVFGDMTTMHYLSNRAEALSPLPPGIHGLSNQALDSDWPKLSRTKARFKEFLDRDSIDPSALLEMLADREPASDEALPDSDLSPELEKRLSAPFVVTPRYGTRSSTVLTIRNDGEIRFTEHSFESDGSFGGNRSFEFACEL